MALIPHWMRGGDITAVALNCQAVSAAGALTDGVDGTPTNTVNVGNLVTTTGVLNSSLVHTVGALDSCEIQQTKITENISSISRERAHNVPYSYDYTVTLGEILRPGSTSSQLARIWHFGQSNYVKLTLSRARRKLVVYTLMTSYEEIPGRSRSVGRATFRLIDTGTDAVTITSGSSQER